MPISLIAAFSIYKNRPAIGYDNKLIANLEYDKHMFNKLLQPNTICVMGARTFDYMPSKFLKALKDHTLIVLTNTISVNFDPNIDMEINSLKDLENLTYFMNGDKFIELYTQSLQYTTQDNSQYSVRDGIQNDAQTINDSDQINIQSPQHNTQDNSKNIKNNNRQIFVLGGGETFEFFLKNDVITPTTIYITHVILPKNTNTNSVEITEPNRFMPFFDYKYELTRFSKIFQEADYKLRFLIYTYNENSESKKHHDFRYNALARHVLAYGTESPNRTGIPTLSVFGSQMRFNIENSIPLLTTRRVPFKAIIEELLWFCRGDTDATVLASRGVNIWNGNSSREFLDSRGLYEYPDGVIGPGYGWQWRHFGAKYNPDYADTRKFSHDALNQVGGFDQLEYVLNLLKTDPFSRRIMMSAWNPVDLEKMALPPCHVKICFNVQEFHGQKYLSAKFSMRSSDSLAWTYNVVSYTILVYILAMKCDMKPYQIIYDADDTHIYTNHITQIREQLSRTPRPAPVMAINPAVKDKDWSEMVAEDFELIGYFPHPSINMPMAV